MSFLQEPGRDNELILNTPNRLEILKEGLPINQSETYLLGRGTYGTVIKAIYKAKAVAVKIIKNPPEVNEQTALSEANVLGWLHPNIVRIFKIESTPKFSIVVMERFNGHCLQKVLDTIELPLCHRVFIALDVLSGLMHCHKNYLLHMDIKPQNIMVQIIYAKFEEKQNISKARRTYKCKLCDFGSSIKISKENPQVSGLTKGTLRYMAPEVLKQECVTAAADIFSLGIALWQMRHRLMPYYWLECNEIVAYQVVKLKLRPNAPQSNAQELKKWSNETHDNCLCETNSAHLSCRSLENLRNILNKTKCELITEKISSVEYPMKRIDTKRKPLLDRTNTNSISQKLNVKRDLKQDFMLIDAFALMNVFKKDINFVHSPQKEQMYENIFKSCWHSDFRRRPTACELIKSFKQLM